MQFERIGAVAMRRLRLEILRQIDDRDRVERTLFHADAAANAQLFRNPRLFRLGRHLDADFACAARQPQPAPTKKKRKEKKRQKIWLRGRRRAARVGGRTHAHDRTKLFALCAARCGEPRCAWPRRSRAPCRHFFGLHLSVTERPARGESVAHSNANDKDAAARSRAPALTIAMRVRPPSSFFDCLPPFLPLRRACRQPTPLPQQSRN